MTSAVPDESAVFVDDYLEEVAGIPPAGRAPSSVNSDPADGGSKWRPVGNLPFHHTLGDYSSATQRFDAVPSMALWEVSVPSARRGGS